MAHVITQKEQAMNQNPIEDRVKGLFPTSETSEDVVRKVTDYLKLSHACCPENTLYGQSVCSDEINFESGDITDDFTRYWGEVFQLGGLAGIPFTGKTGFKAFAHHIAAGKNLFILYAPHIGVSEDGVLGMYNRKGTGLFKPKRDPHTVADLLNGPADPTCGAACGALQHCAEGKQIPVPGLKFGDYQMQFIINQVNLHFEKFPPAEHNDDRQIYLTRVIFNVAKVAAELMVRQNHPPVAKDELGRHVYLLGGIQINMPYPLPDRFVPLALDMYNPASKEFDSVLAAAFNRDVAEVAKGWDLPVVLG